MGTRHLIAVMVDGEYKVAQYGQWDGNFEGQGTDVLEFLLGADHEAFKEKCRKARWLTKKRIAECDAETNWPRVWPELSRDAGSDVLAHIADGKNGIQLKNGIEFVADSVFCEYAYVIDFDKGTFEVFTGWNKEDLDPSARFASFTKELNGDGEYKQIKHLITFKLDALPSEPAFVKACKAADKATHPEDYEDEEDEDEPTVHGGDEMIVAAAIYANTHTYSLPAPARHNDIIKYMVESCGYKHVGTDAEQGFLTSRGNFARRRPAKRLAQAANQLLERAGGGADLFSEDVW